MIDKGYLLGERYRIIDTLGEGGMANVYLAEDIILQRKVAVKILRLDLQNEPQTQARFQREALATSELSHPNIVSVLDVVIIPLCARERNIFFIQIYQPIFG